MDEKDKLIATELLKELAIRHQNIGNMIELQRQIHRDFTVYLQQLSDTILKDDKDVED